MSEKPKLEIVKALPIPDFLPPKVNISRKRDQRAVTRRYYPGDLIPPPKALVEIIRRDVRAVDGFEFLDLAGATTVDDMGVVCFQYTALFERDGTTLEAQAAIRAEREAEDLENDG